MHTVRLQHAESRLHPLPLVTGSKRHGSPPMGLQLYSAYAQHIAGNLVGYMGSLSYVGHAVRRAEVPRLGRAKCTASVAARK